MNVGVPKERRPHEYRVGLPPAGVALLVKHGHTVYVEEGAGEGAGFRDSGYEKCGGRIVYSQEEVFGRADWVLKFARPLKDELMMMQSGATLMGFLHLAAARKDKIEWMQEHTITAIAYEQIQLEDGYRPVLAPLSQIGGRLAMQISARLLQNNHGGRGILLGGAPGVPSAEVVIIGGGAAGEAAAEAFAGAGAHVTVLDIDLRRLHHMQSHIPENVVTMLSTPHNVARACAYADVLLGAVLIPGRRTPLVVTREMVASMKPRSAIIDLSIDQGGCVETSRPTHYDSPTYLEEGVIHFCVPNMPGVLGRTATHALYNSAYGYLETIARLGIEESLNALPDLERGLNLFRGEPRHLNRLGENSESLQ